LYETLNVQMPIIVPRFSATIFEPAVHRALSELPFTPDEFNMRPEDLEAAFMRKAEQFDINDFASQWIREIEDLVEKRAEIIQQFDSTLVGTLEKVRNDQISSIENLKSKMYKSSKSRQQVQIKRIKKVHMNLFPNRNLQERELASIYVLAKFGVQFVDLLYDTVSLKKLNQHALIYL
jgi:bacillithiol synthase